MAKKRGRWDILLLVIFLLFIFFIRMEFSTSQDALSYESYLTVRNVEHIHEKGVPISEDSLSLTGQERVGSPVFNYILAGFVFITPAMYKIVPNLFMVLLLIPIFFLTWSFTKSRGASFLAVVLAATAPSVFSGFLNTPSATPLAIGLFLSVILLLQRPDRNLYWIVGCTLLLAFLSPVIFILVISLLMIILLLRLEGFGVDKRINELFFFTLVLAVWFHVLVYKRALFTHGFGVLWQNLPAKYAALQFGTITFIDMIYGLGVITFLFGVFGTYHALFEQREKLAYTVIGAELAIFFLVVLRVIEIRLGLLLISLFLSVMAGHGLRTSVRYLQRTKFPWTIYILAGLTLLLFLMTAILPALTTAKTKMLDSPDKEDIVALTALKNNFAHGSVVLSTVREASAVQYFSGHTTVTDDDFLLLKNGDELVKDIDTVYTSRFVVTIVGKADKLGFTHILFSKDAQQQYNRDELQVDASACLSKVPISEQVAVYRILCRGGLS